MKIIKRKANLIPYCIVDNKVQFFLSHRSKTAKQYPDLWSFWGGGIEDGETAEQAVVREIFEELDWRLDDFKFLGIYHDSMPNEKTIYFTKVGVDFEKQIEIREGQGGKFFTIDEIKSHEMIIPEDKKVLIDLHDTLEKVGV